ncbi:hypothetical protein HAZT_HAZT004621, partial [Hyalella azteca]
MIASNNPIDDTDSKASKANSIVGDSNFKKTQPKFVPPDGGYGWVVALASCMANMWIVGFLRSYSVLYLSIINQFGGTAYRASWIHAMLTTSGLLMSPVTGLLCTKYGSRKVAIGGGMLAFAGLFLSAFASSITAFIFTLGLLAGLGIGFIVTPGILIVNLYFDKRRTIACAICMSGNAFGAFFMPPLLEYLLSAYGLRGTLLISSALQLHCVVAACLFRPTDVQARIQEQDRKNAMRSARRNSSLPTPAGDFEKKPTWSKLEAYLSLNLDTRRKSSAPQALFYIHAFYASVDMRKPEVTALLSISSAADFCGRFIIGFVADYSNIRTTFLISA